MKSKTCSGLYWPPAGITTTKCFICYTSCPHATLQFPYIMKKSSRKKVIGGSVHIKVKQSSDIPTDGYLTGKVFQRASTDDVSCGHLSKKGKDSVWIKTYCSVYRM